jgi:oligoendopeptidase F
MPGLSKRWLVILLLAYTLSFGKEKDFEPIPQDLKTQYRMRFENFFSSPEAEVQERKVLENRLKDLEGMKENILATGNHLLRAFELLDKIRFQFRKHDLYLFFRFATNMKEESTQKDANTLRGISIRAREIVEQAVLNTSEEKLKQLFHQEPKLEKYRFAVEAIRRQKPFSLPPDQEELLNEIQPLVNGDFYQRMVAELDFGTMKTPQGKELHIMRQGREIENHPDPRVRREGRKKFFETLASKRDVLAFGLIQLIQMQNKLSQLHKFKNFREEFFFEEYLTSAEVKNVYDQLAAQSELYRRFEKMEEKRRGSLQTPRFSIVEASTIIRKALEPLGSEYVDELTKLLDPKNGRIDIVGAENRLPMQGGASVYPIGISTFFAFNYEGYYIDVMLIAHEAGHAVQAMLMSNNKVPMAYAAGPGYFTESFGRFNEFLVAKYLYENEVEPARREFFDHQFSERAFALFHSVIEASIENAIHEAVSAGKLQDAEDINRIAKQTGALYSDRFNSEEERKMLWMDAPEYYVAPLHKTHNVFASLLAMKYYSMYEQNRADFARRYMALLKNGYNASPDSLLQQFMGIDLRDPALVRDAVLFLGGLKPANSDAG